jgi:integrase
MEATHMQADLIVQQKQRRFGAIPMQSFSPEEWARLLEVAKQRDPQDWLILSLAYEGFLRVSEVLALRSGDILPDGRIVCRRLKGSVTNCLPIRNTEARQFLAHVIKARPNKGDRLFDRNRRTLDWRIKRYGGAAGIPLEKCHMHATKHTACQRALEETDGRVLVVKALAGHADIGSTLSYVGMNTETALAFRNGGR